jgi:hypothetical protein
VVAFKRSTPGKAAVAFEGRHFDDLNPVLIRHLIGDEIADMLRVPQSDVVDELGWPPDPARREAFPCCAR